MRETSVRFLRANLNGLRPCDSGVAGLVSCNLLLEHIEDLGHFFRGAARTLERAGRLFVSEPHPCRRQQGGRARLPAAGGRPTTIEAYRRRGSEEMRSASAVNWELQRLEAWWHDEDGGGLPRRVTFASRKLLQGDPAL